MADCSCYRNDINFIGERGVCWGTREKEPCRCGGDETKCDFYPKRAVIVLSKDKTFESKLDGETSQIQVIKDMKKYGLAVMSPQTNYDRLVRKSPEELAEWIHVQIIDRNIGVPSETWLNWLKQEAENDDER